ncbi:MAG: membrane protein insertion efficiency factor YidD [Acidimicrobiales bacterium]|nr:MAG: membrane protein insertion efficiency factor YidD [Acidimicrobiales bacterium]
MSWGRRGLVGLIRFYQVARVGHPSPCRYWPTCSAYAAEAIAIHGVLRGLGLGICRLARCRPGGDFGIDEVPALSTGLEHESLEATVVPPKSLLAGKS